VLFKLLWLQTYLGAAEIKFIYILTIYNIEALIVSTILQIITIKRIDLEMSIGYIYNI
jgi:hypothetical protein